jgi:hypothetical protein
MTIGASAAIGTSLLILAAFAELRDTVPDPSNYGIRVPTGGFAPIVAQPQNRVGTATAVVLLTIPLIALIVQAMHVGQLARDQARAMLSLGGATPQEMRRVAIWETATAFAWGGALAGPGYLVLWLLLGVLPAPGSRLIPAVDGELVLSWLGVTAALIGMGALSGRFQRQVSPLGVSRPSSRSRHWLRGIIAAGAAICLPLYGGDVEMITGDFFPFVIVVEVLLVVTAAASFITWFTSRTTPSRLRADRAVELLAAAQRRGYPGGAGWVGAVLFVCGLAFYVEVAFLMSLATDSDTLAGDVMFYAGPTFVAMAAGGLAVAVAVGALAIRMADHLMTAHRAVAATAALGVEPGRLLAVQSRVLAATAVPATLVGYLTPAVAVVDGGPSPTLAVVLLTAPLLWVGLEATCYLVARLLSPRILEASTVAHVRTP